jgi:hypothetical protein
LRNLLIATAIIEIVTGGALLVMPSLVSSILLGTPLESAAGLIVGRVAGTALLSLGIACWLARLDEQSRATAGLVGAMLFYNAIVATLLAYARVGVGLTSAFLWPAALLHALMAVWCAISLQAFVRSLKRAG